MIIKTVLKSGLSSNKCLVKKINAKTLIRNLQIIHKLYRIKSVCILSQTLNHDTIAYYLLINGCNEVSKKIFPSDFVFHPRYHEIVSILRAKNLLATNYSLWKNIMLKMIIDLKVFMIFFISKNHINFKNQTMIKRE